MRANGNSRNQGRGDWEGGRKVSGLNESLRKEEERAFPQPVFLYCFSRCEPGIRCCQGWPKYPVYCNFQSCGCLTQLGKRSKKGKQENKNPNCACLEWQFLSFLPAGQEALPHRMTGHGRGKGACGQEFSQPDHTEGVAHRDVQRGLQTGHPPRRV